MVCHGELAASRPPVNNLTEFYLLISVGGVLGGIFNAIVAPVAFRSVLEFPIVLICAALLRRPSVEESHNIDSVGARRKDWIFPVILGVFTGGTFLLLRVAGIKVEIPVSILIFGIAMVCCLSFGRRPLRFGLGTAAVFLASFLYVGPYGNILHTDRSFFGVYRVTIDQSGNFRYLLHGGTVHGLQNLDSAISRKPLAYYTSDGPAGQVSDAVRDPLRADDWAIIGLGAGAMACLVQPHQALTYYEIDPLVVRIATNPQFFTFIRDCAPQAEIVIGDARLKLATAADAKYRLIVLDAFSGDAIPMHLMTREALALYLSKLAPEGILAFHITNQYLNLAPLLGNLAKDAHLVCRHEDDAMVSPEQAAEGKFASHWVVMARNKTDLARLVTSTDSAASWLPLEGTASASVWTDDYSNLLRVIRWK
jgi:hypothetical protein